MSNAGLEPANFPHWDAVWVAFKLAVRGRRFAHRRPSNQRSPFDFSGERIANTIWERGHDYLTEDSATAEALRSIGLDTWAREGLHYAARRVDTHSRPFDKE